MPKYSEGETPIIIKETAEVDDLRNDFENAVISSEHSDSRINSGSNILSNDPSTSGTRLIKVYSEGSLYTEDVHQDESGPSRQGNSGTISEGTTIGRHLKVYSEEDSIDESENGVGGLADSPTFRRSIRASASLDQCKRRTRSLNAPSPVQQFGPCGRIMKNSAMVMTIQDPASQRLTWYKPPLSVLVIKKVRDAAVIPPFIQLVEWFISEKSMVVFVESAVMDDPLLINNPAFGRIKEKLMTFTENKDDLTDKIDFVVCLGGDGTLLYASSLFQMSVPPIMAFHLGSLGFLTPFKFQDFQTQVTHVLEGHAALTLRSRLRCILIKKEEELNNLTPATNQLVLNEVVIDRGPSPYLSNIDLYLDGKLITSVQGDGLIVSTPTGSTAYAVAAGASMIHPSVPAVMVTPICPHSLSFRPIVVPAGIDLKVTVSPDSRNTAWVSFDGRLRQELCHGDSLIVNTSIYPIPSICAQDQISDWFDSLAECLHWNVRKKQKNLDELTDLTDGK